MIQGRYQTGLPDWNGTRDESSHFSDSMMGFYHMDGKKLSQRPDSDSRPFEVNSYLSGIFCTE